MTFRMRRLATQIGTVALAVPLGMVGFTGVAGASGSAARSVIKIGYIGDQTGPNASSFGDGSDGALARIDAQNAAGGVDGHKLQLVIKDDETNPSENVTDAQDLVENDGVFGIINLGLAVESGPYLSKAGIPVTGYGWDGSEWGTKPNTDFFDALLPSATFNGVNYYYDSGIAKFLKTVGVKSLAFFSYGALPEAKTISDELAGAVAKVGIKACYEDSSVPLGAADFTAEVLAMKTAGCNAETSAMADSSEVALSQEVKQGGISNPEQYLYVGYDSATQSNSTAMAALNGDYINTPWNFIKPNAPTVKMLTNIEKYDPHFKKGDVPDIGLYGGYLSADLMIQGLEKAGKNPTRTAFISNLRKDCSYNAEGLLPSPVTMCGFGTGAQEPPNQCTYVVQVKGTHYVLANKGKLICSSKEAFTGS